MELNGNVIQIVFIVIIHRRLCCVIKLSRHLSGGVSNYKFLYYNSIDSANFLKAEVPGDDVFQIDAETGEVKVFEFK